MQGHQSLDVNKTMLATLSPSPRSGLNTASVLNLSYWVNAVLAFWAIILCKTRYSTNSFCVDIVCVSII